MRAFLCGIFTIVGASALLGAFGYVAVLRKWQPPSLPEFALGGLVGVTIVLCVGFVLINKFLN